MTQGSQSYAYPLGAEMEVGRLMDFCESIINSQFTDVADDSDIIINTEIIDKIKTNIGELITASTFEETVKSDVIDAAVLIFSSSSTSI